MAKKVRTKAMIVKAPTRYTIIDEDGVVRGTSNSNVSAIDIARDIGFDDVEEMEFEECLKHIYGQGLSLHSLS